MSNLYRRDYTTAELDPTIGRPPEYGNPGSISHDPVTGVLDGRCDPCDVSWRLADQGECWVCGGKARRWVR